MIILGGPGLIRWDLRGACTLPVKRYLKTERDLIHGNHPFLDLKIEGLYGKENGWPLWTKWGPQLIASKETRTSDLQLKDRSSANNLNVHGSGFSPRGSRRECNPADSLISDLPEQRTQASHAWTSDLQLLWDNKWMLFSTQIVVICFSLIENWYIVFVGWHVQMCASSHWNVISQILPLPVLVLSRGRHATYSSQSHVLSLDFET